MDLPEMHRLEANLALPHPLEPTLLRLLLRTISGALPPPPTLPKALSKALRPERLSSLRAKSSLAKQRPRGAEEGVCRCHPL